MERVRKYCKIYGVWVLGGILAGFLLGIAVVSFWSEDTIGPQRATSEVRSSSSLSTGKQFQAARAGKLIGKGANTQSTIHLQKDEVPQDIGASLEALTKAFLMRDLSASDVVELQSRSNSP